VIKEQLGDRIDGWVHQALPFLFWRRLDPNLLSVLGVVVSVSGAVALGMGSFLVGGLLVLLGGGFDLVDGVVARHQGSATAFGAFLDSTLDRLVDMAILLGILMYYASEGSLGAVFLAGFALVASVLVSYAMARAELYLPSFGGGVFERGERIVILALGALTGYLIWALWLVAIGAGITVAQRFALAYREMAHLEAPGRPGVAEHPSS
jgi:CDP-diacylglycerol--glycerol-3-phosphate 3-phosphatidyltransferase